MQLAVLCLTLLAVVNVYQKHFSFNAAMNQLPVATHTLQPVKALLAGHPSPEPPREYALIAELKNAKVDEPLKLSKFDDSTQAAVKQPNSMLTSTNINASFVQPGTVRPGSETSAEFIRANQVELAAEVARAEIVLETKKLQTEQLEIKIQKAKQLLQNSQLKSTPIVSMAKQPVLQNHEWIETLHPEQFVIQVASSTDYKGLIKDAQDAAPHDLLAIYPFKKTPKGNVIYGLSTGLYESRMAALKDAPLISKANKQAVWVRQVADVKTEIAALK